MSVPDALCLDQSTSILGALRSASPAQWLRLAVAVNEVRGLGSLAEHAGELARVYVAGWDSVVLVAAHLDRVPLLFS